MPLPDSQSEELSRHSPLGAARYILNTVRKTRFSTLKQGYTQAQIIPYASYSPWLDDEAFLALFERVRECTMVDIYRCYELYTLAKQIEKR